MRLGRLVAAGLVLGAVVGFVAAFVRPRGNHSVPSPADRSAVELGRQQNGADLPTRPLPLPIQPELSGTGGSR